MEVSLEIRDKIGVMIIWYVHLIDQLPKVILDTLWRNRECNPVSKTWRRHIWQGALEHRESQPTPLKVKASSQQMNQGFKKSKEKKIIVLALLTIVVVLDDCCFLIWGSLPIITWQLPKTKVLFSCFSENSLRRAHAISKNAASCKTSIVS